MIFISTALYCEAEPFIIHLKLKKDTRISKYQIFRNDRFTLCITGTGVISATVAVTYMLTYFNAGNHDIFINVGICGSKNPKLKVGDTFLCNKIIHHDTNRCFYPDILFNHTFSEGILETFSSPVNAHMKYDIQSDIVDMEGSGVFQAASVFFPPHSIFLIKTVSDFIYEDSVVSKTFVTSLIKNNVAYLCDWCLQISELIKPEPEIFSKHDKELLDEIIINLNLSAAMKAEFIKLCKNYMLRKGNMLNILSEIKDIKVKSRRERSMYFERLKLQLMEA